MNENVCICLLNVSDKYEQLLSISHELLIMIIYGSCYDVSEEELSKCTSKLCNLSIVQIKVLEDAVVFQSERSILEVLHQTALRRVPSCIYVQQSLERQSRQISSH